MNKVKEAVIALENRLNIIGGCTDGNCIIVKPKGMHTNGVCRCSSDSFKMQRFAYAHKQFLKDITKIIETTKEDKE